MGTYHGKSGVVKITSNAIAEVTGFTVETDIDVADDTVQGDTWKTHLPGMKGWRGTINARHYPEDTNGQAELEEGDTPSLVLYPDGDAAGRQTLSGTATVTGVSINSNKDGVVEATYQVTGNGALTRGTVGA